MWSAIKLVKLKENNGQETTVISYLSMYCARVSERERERYETSTSFITDVGYTRRGVASFANTLLYVYHFVIGRF